MRKLPHTVSLAYTIFFCMSAIGSDKALNEAMSEEKAIAALSGKFSDLKEQFKNSRVFSDQEVEATGKVSQTLGKVKDEQMSQIVQELGKAVSVRDSATKNSSYQEAGKGYQMAVRRIEGVSAAEGKQFQNAMKNKELLDAQKNLLDALNKYKKDLNGKPPKDDDLEKLANLSERQEELRAMSDSEQMKEKMKQARSQMQKMQLNQAVKTQQEIVKELEKSIADDPASQSDFADSAEMAQMDKMDKALSEAESKLQESVDGKNKLDDMARSEIAMEMSKLGQQDKELAGDIDKAAEETMNWEDKEALKDLGKSKKKLQDKRKQLAGKMKDKQQKKQQADKQEQQDKQAQQQDQPPQDAQNKAEIKNQALEQGERRVADANDWRGKLPAKERAALITARKAKFSPGMEEEVKKYFIELAQ